MKIITAIREMQQAAESSRYERKKIGIVPTMGFLHEGHLSLVQLAKQNSDVVVMTIFVNPSQFGPGEDYSKYPRDIERDKKLAASAGTDIVFIPEREEMYPHGSFTSVEVEKLANVLEGKSRPGHFRGVTTVVTKLFNIVKPNVAVFGQKDAQQVIVIKQMVRDLNIDVDVIVAQTVREPDGLAMSSRNVYLSPSERQESTALYRSLQLAHEIMDKKERKSATIILEMTKLISSNKHARIDYVSIANAITLEELKDLNAGDTVLVSLAVFIGSTRLIDNQLITVGEKH